VVSPSTSLLPPPFHPEGLDGVLIQQHMDGAAGPSGLDVVAWKKLCTSFRGASDSLCAALAAVARRLATAFVDPAGLAAFTTCCLIALNKNPGIRPIGIGEFTR